MLINLHSVFASRHIAVTRRLMVVSICSFGIIHGIAEFERHSWFVYVFMFLMFKILVNVILTVNHQIELNLLHRFVVAQVLGYQSKEAGMCWVGVVEGSWVLVEDIRCSEAG